MPEMESMTAHLLRPEDVLKETPDDRDIYTLAQASEMLAEVELIHQQAKTMPLDWTTQSIREFYHRWWSQINLVSGLRGKGKSLLAIYIALMFYMRGHLVFSNIGARFGYLLVGPSIYGIARLPQHAVVVLDEGHIIFNKWTQMTSRQRAGTGGIANLRKRMISVIMPTSQEYNMGMDVMSELGYVWYPRQKAPVRSQSYEDGTNRKDFISYDWANLIVEYVGPRPVRGKFIGEEYGISVSGPKPRRRVWFPPAISLEHAAACYSSYVDIPNRDQAGTNVTSKDMAKLDLDADISLVDVITFGDDGSPDAQIERDIQSHHAMARMLVAQMWEEHLKPDQELITFSEAWSRYRSADGPADADEFFLMLGEYLHSPDEAPEDAFHVDALCRVFEKLDRDTLYPAQPKNDTDRLIQEMMDARS